MSKDNSKPMVQRFPPIFLVQKRGEPNCYYLDTSCSQRSLHTPKSLARVGYECVADDPIDDADCPDAVRVMRYERADEVIESPVG